MFSTSSDLIKQHRLCNTVALNQSTTTLALLQKHSADLRIRTTDTCCRWLGGQNIESSSPCKGVLRQKDCLPLAWPRGFAASFGRSQKMGRTWHGRVVKITQEKGKRRICRMNAGARLKHYRSGVKFQVRVGKTKCNHAGRTK